MDGPGLGKEGLRRRHVLGNVVLWARPGLAVVAGVNRAAHGRDERDTAGGSWKPLGQRREVDKGSECDDNEGLGRGVEEGGGGGDAVGVNATGVGCERKVGRPGVERANGVILLDADANGDV